MIGEIDVLSHGISGRNIGRAADGADDASLNRDRVIHLQPVRLHHCMRLKNDGLAFFRTHTVRISVRISSSASSLHSLATCG
jgi:hypothetical protein